MSDALTDINRDQWRDETVGIWLYTVYEFLIDPSDSNRASAESAARNCDSIPRGYWNRSTTIGKSMPGLLDALDSGDIDRWAWILSMALAEGGLAYEPKVYGLLNSLFPWSHLKMVVFDYGYFSHGLNDILKDCMLKAGKGTTFGGNPYGHFVYATFYDSSSTLQELADRAACIEIKVNGWTTGKAYIKPTSCKLEYLNSRKEMLSGQNE